MARYTPADKSLYKYGQDKVYEVFTWAEAWEYIQSRVYNRRGLEIFYLRRRMGIH